MALPCGRGFCQSHARLACCATTESAHTATHAARLKSRAARMCLALLVALACMLELEPLSFRLGRGGAIVTEEGATGTPKRRPSSSVREGRAEGRRSVFSVGL